MAYRHPDWVRVMPAAGGGRRPGRGESCGGPVSAVWSVEVSTPCISSRRPSAAFLSTSSAPADPLPQKETKSEKDGNG